MVFVESPFGRIVAVHWEDEEEPPPEGIPPDAVVCGFYELHNGNVTFTSPTGILSFDAHGAYQYALAFYQANDPPGYPHDDAHHSGRWFTLGPAGIIFNTPKQPPNAFNVPTPGAIAFLIQFNQDLASDFIPPSYPGAFGWYLIWTNFLDVSTWVWVENDWLPALRFNANTVGLGYSNMAYAEGNAYGFPPNPTRALRIIGETGRTATHLAFNYIYNAVGTTGGRLTGDPNDVRQGGAGMFTQFLLTNYPISEDARSGDPPVGTVYIDNTPNVVTANEYYLRITAYCRDTDHSE